MASAGLIEELTCSFCLSIYTDPVILTCGHSFCRVCIGDVLDTQEEGRYSCPECRETFRTRPELRRSLRLRNIARSLFDTEPVLTMAGISCSYCITSPVPASKTCLLCEASLCEEHLRVHSKSAEHVLTEPTTSTDKRKCSVHREILKYYCTKDAVCICVSCNLAGEHRGHQVETLNEASGMKTSRLMASAGLREELTCSVCLSVYTDPVTLTCGHSFCRVCIGNALDTQEGSGVYSCPECRAEFQERPPMVKNRKLCNITKTFLSTHPAQEDVGVSCTYCDSPVPAAKTCLLCEASLCEKHLQKHSKSPEHVLTEPTASLENRKCSVHREILKYYCTEDAVCICVSCSLAGEHRGHQVETLNEASEKKKEKLRNVLQKLTSKREETEKRVQSLQERQKAAAVTEWVGALIRDIREQLEALEKRVLSEISRQEEQVSLRVSDLIQQLEIKKEGLSRKIQDIEELCNMTDPLTVLQEQESDRTDFCDEDELHSEEEEDRDIDDRKLRAVDLDEGLISVILHTGLAGIVTAAKRRLDAPQASDILLDVNTAGNGIDVSGDLKTVSRSDINQSRPNTPERFQDCAQVLSTRSFSSGRHYWEVESKESGEWILGVAYPSIDRRGRRSRIGYNKKSWGLWRWLDDQYSEIHDSKVIQLSHRPSCQRLGIFLDYEAGRLSFYELCDPVRHLHTFTTTFTEPLHAAVEVWNTGWVKIRSWD
ncbi:E3 ubiquitin-protein ligase TRIM11-like [Spea bombifrons]|uniref:E3 ubiquitin-protein ligase TRIM11-like n=1 Tax=Spea bombifrons TaxID=233779 RepID=UPI00234ACCE0|nr:E3 ubiquitin-protein ligase TRIM11-like [Spea bombifrons]